MRFSIGSCIIGIVIGVAGVMGGAKFYPDPRSEELARLQGRFDVIQTICPSMVDKLGLKQSPAPAPAPVK